MNCLECNKNFEINIKRKRDKHRKFCSSSCSATHNNKIRYKKIQLGEADKKICRICEKEKEVVEFYKRKGSVDGYRNDCKECLNLKVLENPKRSANKREYYQNNKEKIKNKVKVYQTGEKHKEYRKIYQEGYKERRNILLKERYDTDVLYKISVNVRSCILKAFKRGGYKKNSKSNELLGCSFEELKIHIELQFKDGMNWENHGEWHIDHKTPLSWAKNETELKELCCYRNLQPLWAFENLSKKNYYEN